MMTDRSHGLWEASAPPPPPTRRLEGAHTADVVIVGAGFTGLSAALHLAEFGASVVVIEAGQIGQGGSGRNVGLVNAGLWLKPDEVKATLGELYGSRLLDQLGQAPGLVFDLVERFGIDCEPQRAGTLHCAISDKGLREIAERARQWTALGAPVELLGAAETIRKTGTAAYAGALLDHRAGTIQPLAYARGLAAAAQSLGATIHTMSPVDAFDDLGTGWRVGTSAGSVTAPWLILATNAYSIGASAELAEELVRLPYFNLATQPLSANLRRSILPEGQGVWDTRDVLSSIRLDRAGRLVFGSVGALRGSGRTIHPNWARRALARIFPQLGEIAFDYQWYGQIGMTGDAVPRLHALGRNMVSISGYNGRGIAPGTGFGRDLASLAAGQIGMDALALPVTPVESTRFRPVKEAFYEIGAQVAHATDARL